MVENITDTRVDGDDINTQEQVAKTNSSSSTQEIPINLKEQPNDKIRLNFNKGVGAGEFIKRPTQTEVNRNEPTAQPSPEIKNTVNTGIATLDGEANKYTESVDPAYFEDIAEGITWVIDLIATWLLAKFALDPNVNSTPYKIQKEKIDRLKVVMGKILAQMKTKFPLGWLFFMMLVACYAGSFTKALTTRNENLKLRKDEADRKAKNLKDKKSEESSKPERSALKQKIKSNSHQTETVPFKELIIPQEIEEEIEIKHPPKPERKIIKINKAQQIKSMTGSQKRRVEIPEEEDAENIPLIPPTGKKRGGNFKN